MNVYRSADCADVGHRWVWCGAAGDFSWKNLTSYVCTRCFISGYVEYDSPEKEAETRQLVKDSLINEGLWRDQW